MKSCLPSPLQTQLFRALLGADFPGLVMPRNGGKDGEQVSLPAPGTAWLLLGFAREDGLAANPKCTRAVGSVHRGENSWRKPFPVAVMG